MPIVLQTGGVYYYLNIEMILGEKKNLAEFNQVVLLDIISNSA